MKLCHKIWHLKNATGVDSSQFTKKDDLTNLILLIKSVFNRYKSKYYYNIFLEKASYELPKNTFLKQMVYYDTTDVSEGIDINKTRKSKECHICYYRYFLSKGFKFQSFACNKYIDLLMITMKFRN